MSSAMVSANAFNDIFRQFLTNLIEVFPENATALERYLNRFEMAIGINCKTPRELFMNIVGKYSEQIVNRDERVFETLELPGLKFKTMWTDDISIGTKNAIWAYLQKLLSLC